MKLIQRVLLVSLLSPGIAFGAQVFGSVMVGDSPAALRTVVITCGTNRYDGQTDQRGSYSINVSVTGKCSFSVEGYNSSSVTLYSYPKPTRYDFALSRKADGSYDLVRR